MYDESIFDHFPLSFNLCLQSGVNILSRSRRKYLIENFVDWKSFNDERRALYCDNILENMSGIEICTDVNCTTDHTVHIDTVYDVLIKSFHISTKEFRINRSQKVKMIPGWNNYRKEKYRLAREAFLTWLSYGKIRSGPIFADMKATRKDFVQSLRFCKSNENLMRNNNLVNALLSKNMYQFWKEVRNQKREVQVISDTIDGNDNDDDIANVFYKKFSVISGSSGKADSSKNSSRRIVKDSNVKLSKLFSLSQIQEAIKQTNTGIGLDGVHSNHLKFLPLQSVKFLVTFYNSCIIHKHFPAAMLEGYIRPQIKEKGGDLRSSENFREVMISNNIFKVFEYALLPLL